MNSNEKEVTSMYEDFPVGGEPLDIPDVGVGQVTEFDVAALLEA